MRVKIGDTWYEATAAQPVMIQLTDTDKANIAAMLPKARHYACFAEDDRRPIEERWEWMKS